MAPECMLLYLPCPSRGMDDRETLMVESRFLPAKKVVLTVSAVRIHACLQELNTYVSGVYQDDGDLVCRSEG